MFTFISFRDDFLKVLLIFSTLCGWQVKVGDYNGISHSTLSSSQLVVNPNIPEKLVDTHIHTYSLSPFLSVSISVPLCLS